MKKKYYFKQGYIFLKFLKIFKQFSDRKQLNPRKLQRNLQKQSA